VIETTTTATATGTRLRWWRELLYIVGLYLVYSTVRNQFGSAGGPSGHSNTVAFGHALDVMRLERHLGLFWEQQIQHWYLSLPAHGFIQFWNVFYGTAHFVFTAGALAWLYRRDPARYPRWRNAVMGTTLLALVGFASFSLMPPRLLDSPPEEFGPPAALHVHDFGFVDTLAEYPTLWSFDSGELKNISNQYAAMPSLHIGWATWTALVLFPLVRRRSAKVLVCLYPVATLFCIVVTANHYWLDAIGGLLTLATAFVIATIATRKWDEWRASQTLRSASPAPGGQPV
jgi:hypothetical protein